MSRFLIVRCLKCGQPLLARGGQRSKLCTYCGTHLNLAKLRVFAVADSSAEARHIVQAMKKPQQPGLFPQESHKSES
jgi:DNA-directed RNA polymerase subunit RPC12/RpoP